MKLNSDTQIQASYNRRINVNKNTNVKKGRESTQRITETNSEHSSCTQNYWVFGLCPSYGILETRKHKVSETGSVSFLRWVGEDTYMLFSSF
jgi:hypothetical protein